MKQFAALLYLRDCTKIIDFPSGLSVLPVHNDINIFIAFDAFYEHKQGDLDANATRHKAVLCQLQRVRLYGL
jgi:hypothetical protein